MSSALCSSNARGVYSGKDRFSVPRQGVSTKVRCRRRGKDEKTPHALSLLKFCQLYHAFLKVPSCFCAKCGTLARRHSMLTSRSMFIPRWQRGGTPCEIYCLPKRIPLPQELSLRANSIPILIPVTSSSISIHALSRHSESYGRRHFQELRLAE